jgi:anti-sigma B factor antagonist
MEFHERELDGVTVIDVEGDLVMTASPCALENSVKAALARGARRIVLNVARIRHMDSTCLGELIESFRAAAAHGGALKLAQPDAHLAQLLQTTKLDTVIPTFDTEAAAIASFKVAGSLVPVEDEAC